MLILLRKVGSQNEDRVAMLEAVFADLPSVKVQSFSGLTADFCKEVEADGFLEVLEFFGLWVRMHHSPNDKKLSPNLETIVLFTKEEYSSISSTLVREIIVKEVMLRICATCRA